MPDSPSPLNYFSGTGNLYFKKVGDADYRHLGNATAFKTKPTYDKREHKSSMDGARSVDRTFITGRKLEVTVSLDEITPENLAIAFLGTQSTSSAGQKVIDVLALDSVTGSIKLTGTNDQGSKYEVILPLVEFQPDSEFDWLADQDGVIELIGTASKTAGSFGTITEIASEAT
jgi:hypothetical protein